MHFKKSIFIFYFLLFKFSSVLAQNVSPTFSNIKIVNDKAKKTLVIEYDVMDPDDQYLTVNVDLISKKGLVISGIEMTNDYGASVAVGQKKKIYCDYSKSVTTTQPVSVRLTANDHHEIDVKKLIEQVNVENLKKDLIFIEGKRFPIDEKGAKHHVEVRELIKNRFVEHELFVSLQDSAINSFKIQNIIGDKIGSNKLDQHYILCAHYDAYYGSPGADDNASGVAGLLEVIRILKPYNFENSVKFIGFDLEEDNSLGSRAYTLGKSNEISKTLGVINFDMIGYFSEKSNSQLVPEGFDKLFPEAYQKVASNNFKGDFAVINYNPLSVSLKDVFQKSASLYVPGFSTIALDASVTENINPDLSASDHLSFWNVGVKAIHVGDGGASRNVHINKKGDKSNLINYDYMAKVVQATIATIAKLAVINSTVIYQEPVTIEVN